MYKDREPTQCIKIGNGAESRVNVLRYGADSMY